MAEAAFELELLVQVPFRNSFGATFVDAVYSLRVTIEPAEAEQSGDRLVIQAPLEVLVGSNLIPLVLDLPLAELVEARERGHYLVRTLPVHVEPVEVPERITVDDGETPAAASGRAQAPMRPQTHSMRPQVRA